MKKLLLMVAAVALLGVAPAAAATFTLDSYTIDAHDSDPGLVIETQNIASTPTTFDLNVGQTYSFDLFRIWTEEDHVNWGEDDDPYAINVGMTFSQPGAASGNASGFTIGGNFFAVQGGYVGWNAPVDISFGTTGLFRVSLDEAIFNGGIGGLNNGGCIWIWCTDASDYGANIKAHVTYLREDTPAAVPEPASMMLLGSGLAAAAAYRRRRAQKANQA